jgi:two-component system sensor histidine kinase KdpD
VLAAVAGITAIDYRVLHVNSPTAAFSFLLLILGLATRVGLNESIIASIASMLAYNFFFLPPLGTFTIAEPQNWVALFVFLVTAVTVSHLSSSARRKTQEAFSRERELQRMYDFSRALMLRDPARSLTDQIIQTTSELFQVEDVTFYDREADSVCRMMTVGSRLEEGVLREVAGTGTVWRRDADAHAVVVPIRLGGPCLGSLGVAGKEAISEVALQAIAQLVAIAIERARAEEAASRTEAARQNEQLKATLLDAFAHEFKTPLTSIKAAATSILSREELGEPQRDLLNVVNEEADHLNSLVSEALELARVGAGPLKLHREPYAVDQIIDSVTTKLRRAIEGRVLDVRIEPGLPFLKIDRRLSELALTQLLSNALQYSAPLSNVEIAAERQSNAIVVRVSNVGRAIPKAEEKLIFEKFYRGRDVRARVPGTGMGLPIAREIIEAHGGRIWLNSDPAGRVEFSFTLPAMPQDEHSGIQPAGMGA